MHVDFGGGSASGAVIAAYIAAFAAVAAACVGALSAGWAAARGAYLNSVTAERARWIGRLRDNLARFVGLNGLLGAISAPERNKMPMATSHSMMRELHELAAQCRLQLNVREPAGANVEWIIRLLEAQSTQGNFLATLETEQFLTVHTQWMLKAEWEKVKLEAAAPWDRKRQRAKIEALDAEYKAICAGQWSIERLPKLKVQPATK